jgi:hypothetical protein
MPEQQTLVNQVVKEIKKTDKTGTNEYGNWTLYKLKFMQIDKTFSYFKKDGETLPDVGTNLLLVKYVEDKKGNTTYYTIKKIEIDPTSQSSQQRVSEPTYHQLASSDSGIKEISIFTAYAKDLFVAKMQTDKSIQEMPISEICKQAVLCGRAMYNLAIGKKATPKAAAPVSPPKVEEPPLPEVPFVDEQMDDPNFAENLPF